MNPAGLKAEIELNNSRTFCAYCGHYIEKDDDAASKISKHIMSCPKHPMRIWERHSEALEEQNTELKAKLSRLTTLMNDNERAEKVATDCYDSDHWQLRRKAISDYRADLIKEMEK